MRRLSRLRARPWPLGLLGMLVLVGVVEGWLRRHDRDFATIWPVAWDRAGKVVAREARRSDVLFFGDSLVMHGVAPRVVEAGLGRPSYNLALFKGQAPTAYFLLKRALDAGARPSAVLIDGELLEDDPLDLIRLWPELLKPAEIADLAREARDPDFLAAANLGRVLPSARLRFELREALLAALQGESRPGRGALAPLLRNWRENLGAHIQTADSLAGDEAARQLEGAGYLPGSWACHPLNAAYVERFLALAASRDVPVFWLLPPVQPEVQARRDRGGLSASFEGYLRDLTDRHPHLVVLDGRHAGFPAEAMADMTHLNRLGAVAYSESLAEALRDRLTASADAARWIALPAYREPDASLAAVEDLGQSTEALRQAAEARGRRR